MTTTRTADSPAWYALKVFYSKAPLVQDAFRKAGHDSYLPKMVVESFDHGQLKYAEKPIVASLLFVHCTAMLYYTDPAAADKHKPGRIPDREMDNFRIATSIASTDPGAMYLGSDAEKLCTGDRVRVTEGIYKGAEGYVKRIRHARKVLVAIKGVAVVALSNIPPQYLEKIDN